MKKSTLWLLTATLVSGFALAVYSCGGSGSSSDGSSGDVALYLTDDLSPYTQVTATIDSVRIVNTGSGAGCDVLTDPVAVNLSALSKILHLIAVTPCPSVSYNRIRLGFERGVKLTSAASVTSPASTATCTFDSYKDQGNSPNVLACSGATCTLDINGAVNVLAAEQNKLALDFNLKDFDVTDFGTPSCSVTMKVSPLSAADIASSGNSESITGVVSALSTTDKTFTLTRGKASFAVLYSSISSTAQPGLDTLLATAETGDFKVLVTSAHIDLATKTVAASAIYLKADGSVSNLDTAALTFTLTAKKRTALDVDYGSARLDGSLADGVSVEVKLSGVVADRYIASTVDAGDGEPTVDN